MTVTRMLVALGLALGLAVSAATADANLISPVPGAVSAAAAAGTRQRSPKPKPSRLTDDEYEVIKTHAELSARMVEEILSAEQVGWILGHHERPDGRGYPQGLVAEQLSEGAALLAAADAFDVMVSARPYSAERSAEDALAECRSLSGAQFTPEAVAALEAVNAYMITA